ncbi:MAG: Thymidine phosphorylase, partial [Dehalococcoidia bacterium]|nr:Thymidine phosphorylase [Dehalococcoidia bacterium]
MTVRLPHGIAHGSNLLKLRRMGIDTYQEPVLYMAADCHVCRSEGFEARSRVEVSTEEGSVVTTLNVVYGDMLTNDEAGLSEVAWKWLHPREGQLARMSHPKPLQSFRHVRAKLFGSRLDDQQLQEVVRDIAERRYSEVHLAAFITACGTGRLDTREILGLTRAMVAAGETLSWDQSLVADKHCVGGLPGNRTTPIVVAIAAASGLCIPKTSSRAITSPAGTADAMETMAPVDLSIESMRRVVDREGGCVVWGGSVQLSPADDILVRVERVLDVDTEGQLVASVLSKKRAAGSTHLIIDIPVGSTAKVRTPEAAASLAATMSLVAAEIGIHAKVLLTDGSQPVGRGIGPALEAQDVLRVLRGDLDAPDDLRQRAIQLAGELLELAGAAKAGEGVEAARAVLAIGKAWT